MKLTNKRITSWLLAAAMAFGFASAGMTPTAAAAETENTAAALTAEYAEKSLADIVREYGHEVYDTVDLQGGNSHMQGFCVDDKGEYMYFSYTSALVKVDMKTGEVVGSVGGFGQGSFGTPGGAHLGDLAYYDGKIYGSLEYKDPGKKFFIAAFDEDYITEIGMDMKEMDAGVDGILLAEPTADFRAPLNDTPSSEDGYAVNEENKGHAFGCSGIDGVAFATMPGDDSGKIYMFVAYGIYSWTDRYDNNYNVLQVYDPDDFHTEEARDGVLRRFTYERGLSLDIDEGEALEACDTLYAWTGTTNYGVQNLDTDLDTGDLVLYTYANVKNWGEDNWPGYQLYVVDGSVAPEMKEIEVGQSNTASDEAVKAAAIAKAETYKVDTDGDGVADAYPQGKHVSLKCICGEDCQPQLCGDTGITAMICGNTTNFNKNPNRACYGVISLGDGYFLMSNGQYQGRLYHRDDNYNFTFVSDVLADAVESAGALKEKNYSAESWAVLESALEAAAAVSADPETTDTEKGLAVAAINAAIDGLVEEESVSGGSSKPAINKDAEASEPSTEVEETALYTDVPQTHWAYEAIQAVSKAGLFNGTSAATFSPEAAATRGQLMTVLARLNGQKAETIAQGVAWAVENGISDGTDPDAKITREQLVTMLYRAAGKPAATGDLSKFTDAASLSDWAVEAMTWATAKGIVTGMTETTLVPAGTATRAQIAAIMQRCAA